jgi:hypothetical protein
LNSEVKIDFEHQGIISLKDLDLEGLPVSIQLPDSVFFGKIEKVSADNKYFFIHDSEHSQTVTIIDKKGRFVNQLKKIGGAENEYESLTHMALDRWNNQLLIYDRIKRSILTYSYPEIEFISKKNINTYLNSLEFIDKDHLLVVSDDEINKSQYRGFEIWDRDFNQIKTNIFDFGKSVIELSYTNSFGSDGSSLIYANPLNGTIYRIQKDSTEIILKPDFGRFNVPQELYDFEDANQFEDDLLREERAFWFRMPLIKDNKLLLWFSFKEIENINLLVFDLKTQQSKIYNGLEIDKGIISSDIPIGFSGNNPLLILEVGLLEREKNKSNPKHKLYPYIKNTLETGNPFIIQLN